MQPRSLNQILSELKSLSPFKSLKSSVTNRISQLPAELAKDEGNILNQINRSSLRSAQDRGLAFSGIPIREAAELSAPALANLRKDSRQSRLTLEQALAQAESGLFDTAIGLRENEVNRFEARQAEERAAARARASAAASSGPSAVESILAQLLGGGQQTPTTEIPKQEDRYNEWLKTQLRVTTRPTTRITPPSRRLQGSSPRLQGGSKTNKRKRTFRLQGAGALTGGNTLRVR